MSFCRPPPSRLLAPALLALVAACSTPLPGREDAGEPDVEPCGNGVIDDGEDCDHAIAAGQTGACPTACADSNPCTTETLAGSAARCSARCEVTTVTACTAGDSCCPAGCTQGNDPECAPGCGNGRKESGELCDGDCPTACAPIDACHPRMLQGSAGACTAQCVTSEISACVNGDGCCPPACSSGNDDDCSNPVATCGNGAIDPGESCDKGIGSGLGSCPTVCPPAATCFVSGVVGTAAACSALCQTAAITTCAHGDGCCASGCTHANDHDCPPPTRIGEACTSDSSCAPGLTCNPNYARGYCSKNCTTHAECGPGAHCGNTICMRDCTQTSDCQRADDIECFDMNDDGRTECEEIAFGTGPVGAACGDYGDCAGGRDGACVSDFFEGYCTVECAATTDCPSGSHCLLGLCFRNCAQDSDCPRRNYTCTDFVPEGGTADGVKECLEGADGTGAMGDACTSDLDCSGGRNAGCFTDFPGGLCSKNCATHADCPTGSHCAGGLCLKDCASESQCPRSGYICLDMGVSGGPDGRSECFIGADGPGRVGDPCDGVADCAGGTLGGCLMSTRTAGTCSLDCGDGFPACPPGSTCEAFGSGGSLCVKPCTSDGQCPGGVCASYDDFQYCGAH